MQQLTAEEILNAPDPTEWETWSVCDVCGEEGRVLGFKLDKKIVHLCAGCADVG
jgi:hypothetical protein